ncbi:hypothetical protein MRY17_13780 [Pseudomonas orientalis]|uniref:hypothetical protein n=1 Tax=Pseudomonas orientalis TaxID=76758 RepID=UPI001FAF9AD9|nr:hypothetical protein [Pseudomonas orientalis]UOB21823.1 hypothetical protein MRY17_13780 [Pseudomonas orientalis]
MSQIKERPILFSAPMVRAILEGRKTVTRRPVKASKAHADGITLIDYGKGWWPYNAFGDFSSDHEGMEYPIACPYGKPGDRLWVRETFIDLRGTGVEHRPDPNGPLQRYAYAADCRPGSHSDDARKDFGLKYKPSIHMPRAACRMLLEITDVRVERLQDISRADIRAEGLLCPPELASDDVSPNYRDWYPAAWRELWESTGGDWNANPWVWVVEFKRVTP